MTFEHASQPADRNGQDYRQAGHGVLELRLPKQDAEWRSLENAVKGADDGRLTESCQRLLTLP